MNTVFWLVDHSYQNAFRAVSNLLWNRNKRTLFLGLVQPHLGYATQIWAPQSIELTTKLERIQRRATRFILNLPYSSTISCNSRFQTLNLLLICYWHELLDLVFFFKITHGLVNVDPSVLPDVRKYRRTRSTTTNIKKNTSLRNARPLLTRNLF